MKCYFYFQEVEHAARGRIGYKADKKGSYRIKII